MTNGIELKPIIQSTERTDDPYVQLSNRIPRSFKENLTRLSYWKRELEQDLLVEALSDYFAKQDQADFRPIPPKKKQ